MKILSRTTRSVIATVLAGGALLTASSAFAQHDPMMRDGAPAASYGQPHTMPVGVSINVGWHGDRYYDGHRYWQHDEWMRHHPHDRDPYHHDEHHQPEHY
ncbi:hypothetical protein [Paraburkholderia sp. GAS334]|uniref:hypothetical protein n=1 Tax=Paraburkholderia sp. GAS334 TaxID=3035131 RepID=UPI003D1D4E4C